MASAPVPDPGSEVPFLHCPECWHNGQARGFVRNQELGRHRQAIHGIPGANSHANRAQPPLKPKPHWTQRPENKTRLREMARHRMTKTPSKPAREKEATYVPSPQAQEDSQVAFLLGGILERIRIVAEQTGTPAEHLTRRVAEFLQLQANGRQLGPPHHLPLLR